MRTRLRSKLAGRTTLRLARFVVAMHVTSTCDPPGIQSTTLEHTPARCLLGKTRHTRPPQRRIVFRVIEKHVAQHHIPEIQPRFLQRRLDIPHALPHLLLECCRMAAVGKLISFA